MIRSIIIIILSKSSWTNIQYSCYQSLWFYIIISYNYRKKNTINNHTQQNKNRPFKPKPVARCKQSKRHSRPRIALECRILPVRLLWDVSASGAPTLSASLDLSIIRIARGNARADSPTNTRDLKHDKIKLYITTTRINSKLKKSKT